MIQDNKSIIDGKPYRFQFAIENRRPALDWIDESVSPDKYYYWYINATYGKNLTELYSNVAGHPLSDDYNILIKTTRVLEIFPLGIDPDEGNLTYTYKANPPWSANDFQDSIHYKFGVLGRNYVSGFTSDHPISKDSIFGTSWSGNYNIQINVSDNEGLYDYQDIKVRVCGHFYLPCPS